MDEAALRAMMPMSFGKKPVKKAPVKAQPPPSSDSASGSTSSKGDSLGSSLLGKRRAEDNEAAPEEEDDGLTAEERQANAEAERKERERRAQGLDSDDDADSSSDDDDIGPPPPPGTTPTSSDPAPSQKEAVLPPMTTTTPLSGTHNKTLSALAVDSSGSRFALGSYDYSLSLYDFGGLTPPSYSPFRLFEPTANYPVLDLSFSPTSSHLLVVPGTAQAKLYTRDGAELFECRKGDPYLRDMRNTTGHVAGLTCGMFHPSDAGRFVTGGSDSTVRIWDVETLARGQRDVIVVKSKLRGGRTKVTALQISHESTLVAAGEDGSLQHWDLRGNLNSKPRGSVDGAHEEGSMTSSIAVAGNSVATRGGDGMVKLWDLRSFRSPVAEREGLENGSPHTSVIFDPFNSTSLLTCTTTLPSHQGSGIVVLDSISLSTVESYAVPVEYSTLIRLHWSAATDQLFTTTRSGTLLIHHSPNRSTKGINLALSRTHSSSSRSSSLYIDPDISAAESYPIFSGNTAELGSGSAFQSDSAKKRKLAKARKDPQKTLIPQPPISGPGKGGRIGAGAMQHVVQSIYTKPDDIHQDPRQALLKYANPHQDREQQQFTKAWKTTQPNPIYSKDTDEQQQDSKSN